MNKQPENNIVLKQQKQDNSNLEGQSREFDHSFAMAMIHGDERSPGRLTGGDLVAG